MQANKTVNTQINKPNIIAHPTIGKQSTSQQNAKQTPTTKARLNQQKQPSPQPIIQQTQKYQATSKQRNPKPNTTVNQQNNRNSNVTKPSIRNQNSTKIRK